MLYFNFLNFKRSSLVTSEHMLFKPLNDCHNLIVVGKEPYKIEIFRSNPIFIVKNVVCCIYIE